MTSESTNLLPWIAVNSIPYLLWFTMLVYSFRGEMSISKKCWIAFAGSCAYMASTCVLAAFIIVLVWRSSDLHGEPLHPQLRQQMGYAVMVAAAIGAYVGFAVIRKIRNKKD